MPSAGKKNKQLSYERDRERILKLRKEIEKHRYLYHVMDAPEISDAALDSLKHELEVLENKHPDLFTPDSPTQRIGGEARKEFSKVRHEVPMLSFNDAFSEEELHAWDRRNEDFIKHSLRNGFYCELKIDGLAVSLLYRKGVFASASTRGDGILGEDVTLNLKTIEAIPLVLRDPDIIAKELFKAGLKTASSFFRNGWPDVIEVRGEVFMNTKDFVLLNKAQAKAGRPLYANPRNVAAGSVRQLDPKITASRHLDSFAYDLVNDIGQHTHEEVHAILKIFGFKINTHNRFCGNLDEVIAVHAQWASGRGKLPYEIDGVVVIVNENEHFKKMGVIGKAPRGAIAFKFALKEAETIIEDIKVQVGRTGALTPVAVLKPVQIGGVTVTHASLHNADEIERLGVRIGDTVIVGRAGDVIPKVLRVLPALRSSHARIFIMPQKCPACKHAVERSLKDVIIRCMNPACPAKHREWLYHFTSRVAFDIVGLGPKILDRLLEEGLIEDAADIFTIDPKVIAELARFGEKSSQKLYNSISSRKNISLERFLYALGIPHVGEETASALAKAFGSLDIITKASVLDLSRVEDIGELTAKAIVNWFRSPVNKKLLAKFKKVGVTVSRYHLEPYKNTLSGKTFVLTGSLTSMSRDDAKGRIRVLGGDISETVNKKTDFVVVGSEPGGKYKYAKQLGIKILTEEEFLKLLL